MRIWNHFFIVTLYCLLFHEKFLHLFVYPLLRNSFKHYKRATSSFFLRFLLASIYKSILGVSSNFVLAYVLISPTVFSPFYFLSTKEYIIFLVVAFSLQNSPGSPLTDLDIQEGVSLQD